MKRRAWLTGDVLQNDDETCRRFVLPDDPTIRSAFLGALVPLTEVWNWEQSGSMTPREASEIMTQVVNSMTDDCALSDAPYWDDVDGGDADGDEEPQFAWYENVSDWLVTAFLATSFTPAAAIEFVTTARKLRLWFRTRDYGAIVRVLLDNVEIGTVDTYSSEPGMTEFAYDIPIAEGFSAQQTESWTLRLEHTGTANASAVPLDDRYGMEVVRKHISWSVAGETAPFRLRYVRQTNTVQITYDDGQTWFDAPDVDPRQQYQQPPVNTANPRCDAAARMTAELRTLVNAGIQNVDNVGDAATGAAMLIAGISLLTGANLFFALAVEVADAILWFTSLQLHDAFDEFDWDEMTCQFYCLVDDDGRLDQAGMISFVQDYLNTLPPIPQLVINLNTLLLGWGGLSDYAALRDETGDCDECDICEWEVYITPDMKGNWFWIYDPFSNCSGTSLGWGNVQLGEDLGTYWRTEDRGGGLHAFNFGFSFNLPAGSTLTKLDMVVKAVNGNTDSMYRRWKVNNVDKCRQGAFVTDGNEITVSITGAQTIIGKFQAIYGSPVNGWHEYYALRLTGTGVKPTSL